MRYLFFHSIFLFSLFTQASLAVELWVDAVNGDDNQEGLTAPTALRTLQAAATLATPGTIVHIQPGIYRETVRPAQSGTLQAPIIYRAEQGIHTVIIRGSESALTWTPLTENIIGLPAHVDPQQIIWTDLSAWGLTQAPRFVMQLDAQGQVINRLNLAQEPDWSVATEWKYHEFWWAADGGAAIADCDPPGEQKPSTCQDQPTRSFTQLIDQHDDLDREPGNLTTLGNLTGATLVAMDTIQGHFTYRRMITAHDEALGQVTVDRSAEFNNAETPGLGWGSQYYVENHPVLLDSPGEYWFDRTTGRLYLWPTSPEWQYLEISRYQQGLDLSHRSFLTLDGLQLAFFNDAAITLQNTTAQISEGLKLSQLKIDYANQGIWAETTLDGLIKDFILEYSEISHMDSQALDLAVHWDNPEETLSFVQPPITNIVIKHNQLHHLGFRSQADRGVGLSLDYPDHLWFENNHVHHVAHHGVLFSESVIQSEKAYHFTADEIKTGDILVKNNLIEQACQTADDCGGLTFSGNPPHHHVFKNVLVMGNTFRQNYGWSQVGEKRGRWAKGYFGFGLYLLGTTGIHVYRNLAYNNGWANIFLLKNWRDGQNILYNNLLANAPLGFNIWNPSRLETHDSLDTQFMNNIIINHQNRGIELTADPTDPNLIIDYNLYYANNWGDSFRQGFITVRNETYNQLSDLQSQTNWEIHGLREDPHLFSYDYHAQRQRGDQSVLDFELKRGSAAIERGIATLPASLTTLLTQFGIQEPLQQGLVWDIGPFEYLESQQPPLSQGTAIEIATDQIQETTAQFSGFITTGFVTTTLGQRGNGLTVSQNERIKVIVDMIVDPNHIGQSAQLGMVAAYKQTQNDEFTYFMRQGTNWVPWDSNLASLLSADIGANLPEQFELFEEIPMTVYEGQFENIPGYFEIYVGYSLSSGLVVFNEQPITWTIQ